MTRKTFKVKDLCYNLPHSVRFYERKTGYAFLAVRKDGEKKSFFIKKSVLFFTNHYRKTLIQIKGFMEGELYKAGYNSRRVRKKDYEWPDGKSLEPGLRVKTVNGCGDYVFAHCRLTGTEISLGQLGHLRTRKLAEIVIKEIDNKYETAMCFNIEECISV